MGINYDVTGFNSVEETEMVTKKKKEKEEENPFKGLYNNYQDTQEKNGNYVVNEYNNENISNNNNANTTNTTTNNFTSYDLNRYNMMEEDTKVNLDVFTKITNENPYTSASTSTSVNDKIIIRPRGNN
jgi:hypothetical protein